MCCAFRDGALHASVVTSCHLCYCCLSIILHQPLHSPLTLDINQAFSSTKLLLTGLFLVGSFFCKPEWWSSMIIPIHQQVLKCKHQPFYVQSNPFSLFQCLVIFTTYRNQNSLFLLTSNWSPNKLASKPMLMCFFNVFQQLNSDIHWNNLTKILANAYLII